MVQRVSTVPADCPAVAEGHAFLYDTLIEWSERLVILVAHHY